MEMKKENMESMICLQSNNEIVTFHYGCMKAAIIMLRKRDTGQKSKQIKFENHV